LDRDVSAAFESSLSRLSKAGALITEKTVAAFDRQSEYFKGGGFAGAEAYHIHRANEERIGEYDPRVGKRVLLGKSLTASDYLALGELRVQFMREVEALAAPFDAILMPTVPCIAPTIAQVDASDDDSSRRGARSRSVIQRRVSSPSIFPCPCCPNRGSGPSRSDHFQCAEI